jgi:hypothetical protein
MPSKGAYMNNGVTRLMGRLDKKAKRTGERLAGKR